ncbi:MAG TPA: hypothetical protein VGK59_01225 [Ohtaekwangia sp.]
MLKFILGPIAGYSAGLNLVSTVLGTVAGTMTIVLLFTFFGDFMRKRVLNRFMRNRKRFSERNRKFIQVWRKYGIAGVAIITPLLLTPIGGTLLAISFGTPRDKLIIYMFISASVWALVFSSAIYFFGNEVLPEFVK